MPPVPMAASYGSVVVFLSFSLSIEWILKDDNEACKVIIVTFILLFWSHTDPHCATYKKPSMQKQANREQQMLDGTGHPSRLKDPA
jgi:hypothetical protein